MKRFKDVEHLVRLAALFAAGLLVFSIARAELVPAGFGTLGHYRASAIEERRKFFIRVSPSSDQSGICPSNSWRP